MFTIKHIIIEAGLLATALTIAIGQPAAAGVVTSTNGTGNHTRLPVILQATDFGVEADGTQDDGPAIQRLIEAAAKLSDPVTLRFPSGKIIAVRTAPERYVFQIAAQTNLTIDGGGCEFRLGPDVRFLHLTRSQNVTVRAAKIDFTPLPFADGEVLALNPKTRELDVRLFSPERAAELGGPTHQDGEQDFFGMLWKPGPYELLSQHLYVASVRSIPGSDSQGLVRVQVPPGHPFPDTNEFRGSRGWKISLPVPGIAHRRGPGANVVIDGNDNVRLEDIETWSAPWFAFWIGRNTGRLEFQHVNIRPKPGTTRLTSSWRDGFHVKGNRSEMLFDGCVLIGMNDDAFNVSTHCSRITATTSPTQIVVLQHYPLNYIPFQPGGILRVMDPSGSEVLGESPIIAVTGGIEPGSEKRARPVELTLARPIQGMVPKAIAWEVTSANPHTVLRDCVIRNSCRFQTRVELEHCDVTAFSWFYGATIEGPGPDQVVIRDSILRRGRGNQKNAAQFSGWAERHAAAAANARLPLQSVTLEHNEFYGDVTVRDSQKLVLEGNTFHEGHLAIERCREIIRK
ncbi:MAG: hypothetical protein ACTHLW_21750 [Verrucomicrobiota bacterium]